MSCAVKTAGFLNDKNKFFSKSENYTTLTALDESISTNTDIDYEFLLNNHKLMQQEFEQMFAILKAKRNDENYKVFWFYCYYCASLLETFHAAYSQTEEVEKYETIKKEIKDRLENETAETQKSQTETKQKLKHRQDEESFIESLYQQFKAGFKAIGSIPFHVSKVRGRIGMINMSRIYYIFTRLTLSQALTVANDLQLIAKFDAFFGTHTDVSRIINNLLLPATVSTYLSVGLFAARFLLNAAMLIKHTFFPTEKERENNLTMWARFKYEFEKRHFMFLNDIAWATVNFLTNFGELSHIGGSMSMYLVAAFLTFDVMMMVYYTYLEKKEYLLKRSQYDQELKNYFERQQNEDLTEEERTQLAMQIEMVTKQKAELERNWLCTEAKMYFYTAAAALLAAGFTATILVANPILIIGFYFIALVGVAMYLSVDEYKNYKMKSLILQDLQSADENYVLAQAEFNVARKEFFLTLAKNTVVPMILIGTLAVCWPAAVLLATMYLGYEFYQAYRVYQAKQAAGEQVVPEEVELLEEEMDEALLMP